MTYSPVQEHDSHRPGLGNSCITRPEAHQSPLCCPVRGHLSLAFPPGSVHQCLPVFPDPESEAKPESTTKVDK
ncbi:hypothetical protein E2C01_040092 [Portunus trituberculatus]|uniref:Uncharacterized protein n=1 Tax=Portunus trituberculatus TaxID=210409 RepID=A0A5B7FPT1_PORTR|nr:hypothetical protein [Portunus trituberculatus]